MQETGNNKHIRSMSVQVSLSGYASKIIEDGVSSSSGWMSADRFFTDVEFQKRYDEVEISLFTPKFTLVPEQFFTPSAARTLLSEVTCLKEGDGVCYEPVPECRAVLVYSNSIGESLSRVVSETVLRADGHKSKVLPEVWYMISALKEAEDYNKVIASYADGILYLVIAQGRTLLLCNSYEAADFVTAEYFIFLAMKKFQLNPEMTAISFRTPLEYEQEMSLYRYFKAVETI